MIVKHINKLLQLKGKENLNLFSGYCALSEHLQTEDLSAGNMLNQALLNF